MRLTYDVAARIEPWTSASTFFSAFSFQKVRLPAAAFADQTRSKQDDVIGSCLTAPDVHKLSLPFTTMYDNVLYYYTILYNRLKTLYASFTFYT